MIYDIIESLAYTDKTTIYISDPYKSMTKITFLCILYN